MAVALACPEHADGGFLELLRPLRTGEHDGAPAVGDETDIELAQRIADQRRGQHIRHRERLRFQCFGIERGPLTGGNRHLGQLLARGAEVMHVPLHHHGIAGDREQRAIRPLVGQDVGASDQLAAVAALGTGIGDHRDLALPGCDGTHRMADVRHDRRAADVGRIRDLRLYAQLIGERGRRHPVIRRDGEQPVHVSEAEAGVVQCLVGGFRHDFGDAVSGVPADARRRRAYDGHLP